MAPLIGAKKIKCHLSAAWIITLIKKSVLKTQTICIGKSSSVISTVANILSCRKMMVLSCQAGEPRMLDDILGAALRRLGVHPDHTRERMWLQMEEMTCWVAATAPSRGVRQPWDTIKRPQLHLPGKTVPLSSTAVPKEWDACYCIGYWWAFTYTNHVSFYNDFFIKVLISATLWWGFLFFPPVFDPIKLAYATESCH